MDLTEIEDIIRQHKNRVWIEGGCEAIAERERLMRICSVCQHSHDHPFLICENCGYDKGREMLDKLRAKLKETGKELEDE